MILPFESVTFGSTPVMVPSLRIRGVMVPIAAIIGEFRFCAICCIADKLFPIPLLQTKASIGCPGWWPFAVRAASISSAVIGT